MSFFRSDEAILSRLRSIVEDENHLDFVLEEDVYLYRISEFILLKESIIKKKNDDKSYDTLYFDYAKNKDYLPAIKKFVDYFRQHGKINTDTFNVLVHYQNGEYVECQDSDLKQYIIDFHKIRDSFVHSSNDSLVFVPEKKCILIRYTNINDEDRDIPIKSSEYYIEADLPIRVLEEFLFSFHRLEQEKMNHLCHLMFGNYINEAMKKGVFFHLMKNKNKNSDKFLFDENSEVSQYKDSDFEKYNVDNLLTDKKVYKYDISENSRDLLDILNDEFALYFDDRGALKNSMNRKKILFLYQYMRVFFSIKGDEMKERIRIGEEEFEKIQGNPQLDIDTKMQGLSANSKLHFGKLEISKLSFQSNNTVYFEKEMLIRKKIKSATKTLRKWYEGYCNLLKEEKENRIDKREKKERILNNYHYYIKTLYLDILNDLAEKNIEIVRLIRNALLHGNFDVVTEEEKNVTVVEKVILKDMSDQNNPETTNFVCQVNPDNLFQLVQHLESGKDSSIYDSEFNDEIMIELRAIMPDGDVTLDNFCRYHRGMQKVYEEFYNQDKNEK